MLLKRKRKPDTLLRRVLIRLILIMCVVLSMVVMTTPLPPAPEMNCSTTTLRDDCPLMVRPIQINDRLRDTPLNCLDKTMQGEC